MVRGVIFALIFFIFVCGFILSPLNDKSHRYRRTTQQQDQQPVENISIRGLAFPRQYSSTGNNISHVLWSRNWWPLATRNCPDVPDSYYQRPTDTLFSERVPESELTRYFSTCEKGFVWVRMGSKKYISDVLFFYRHAMPLLKKNFMLITSDGDVSLPRSHGGLILSSPYCEAWYTQNYDPPDFVLQNVTLLNKLFAIPIGLDLHTQWQGFPIAGTTEMFEAMLQFRAARFKKEEEDPSLRKKQKNLTVLLPAMSNTHPERGVARKEVQCLRSSLYSMPQTADRQQLWRNYTQHQFAISPRGNGLDCHRHWELLFFGTIPIIKSSSIDPLFEGLPAVFVENWADVCRPGFLDEALAKVLPLWPAPLEVFTIEYWLRAKRRRSA